MATKFRFVFLEISINPSLTLTTTVFLSVTDLSFVRYDKTSILISPFSIGAFILKSVSLSLYKLSLKCQSLNLDFLFQQSICHFLQLVFHARKFLKH